ncbi:MAG: aspartate--tRNA ligase [Eubacteriales bacterium]
MMEKRTKYCGEFRETDVDSQAVACGWVLTKRDMGGVIFLDLRDREGTLQVVLDQSLLPSADFAVGESLRPQSVISVGGRVRMRSADTYNPKIATGTVELAAESLTLLSSADPLPFTLDDSASIREDLRLKYRYLDLRRPKMIGNLRYRDRIQLTARNFLSEHGFIEVETPMLCKSTPEGARDYLVPSRVHPGSFYALPQSPQIYKQLLMVGGVDKYYQIARCFRDEDLRADRQPEFTQVDLEMSFVGQEEVLQTVEELLKDIFYKMKGVRLTDPFPRITWTEAMDVYGSDKPDLRFDLPIVDLTDLAGSCTFSVFRKAVDNGGVVRGIRVPGGAKFTRTEIEMLTEKALGYGAKGMAWILIRPDGSVNSILEKYFTKAEFEKILQRTGCGAGDFLLFCADKLETVRRTLGGLRLDIADLLGLRKKDEYRFLIITDFPQFEWSEEEGRYLATHHPFTMPYEEDLPYLFSDPGKVRAQAYDFVLNGVELGSGSVRIHDQKVQKTMFEALGFDDQTIEDRFGFMVHAFRYGTPPHAGFAFGLDRLTMLLLGADSLREVIAFPKIKDASCPMTDAPTPVDASQLEVLNLLQTQAEKTVAERRRKEKGGIDIDRIADLAKLSLTAEEKACAVADMEEMIAFAGRLSSVDTAGVDPMAHVTDLFNVFREDEPRCDYTREELLQNAKTKTDEAIYVPRVVE